MAGSRIRVKNSDGSEHCEEICEWGERVVIRLGGFSPPLRHLAAHFLEEWEFDVTDENKTLVTRRFRLYPKSFLTRPALLLISVFFKKAVARHLDEMADEP